MGLKKFKLEITEGKTELQMIGSPIDLIASLAELYERQPLIFKFFKDSVDFFEHAKEQQPKQKTTEKPN